MSLEGNLRDLALPEVCQLLAHTRKSGELRLSAPLAGLRASIRFASGAIVGAEIVGPLSEKAPIEQSVDTAQHVESIALELLTWNEGQFRFVPTENGVKAPQTGVRLHTEMILMEGARRTGEWARLADRLPNARVVPAFAEVEPRQLPLLNLTPQQWEVLTGVDGQRDLPTLARSLGRDLLEVAEIVHGLLGTGLLRLVDSARVLRTQATPPSSAVTKSETPIDLWVPTESETLLAHYAPADGTDDIFDPVSIGVVNAEGLPRLRTPAFAQQSQTITSVATTVDAAQSAREMGDAAARRGDLVSALMHWNSALEGNAPDADADATYAREAIALAARLQQLLHANRPQ